MADRSITEEELAELVRGPTKPPPPTSVGHHRYLALTSHALGYTLLQPFGGRPTRYEDRARSVKASADDFKGGEAKLESVENTPGVTPSYS